MTLEELQERMLGEIPAMPRRLTDGARYVLDNPDDVVIFSMRDLAARAGVSPATLVRLSRYLGFANWSDIRTIHAAHLRSMPAAYARKASAVLAREGENDLLAEAFNSHLANLEHTASVNSAENFHAAAECLARADRVFISAFMSCRGPGHTFAYLCRMLRDNVFLLGSEATSLVTELSTLRSDDVVLSINFQPYSREINHIAHTVERSGASLICLSDSRGTPLTPHADTVLLFSPESPSFFPSITAANALVESLIVALLAHLGDEASDRIARIERELYASGTYNHLNG